MKEITWLISLSILMGFSSDPYKAILAGIQVLISKHCMLGFTESMLSESPVDWNQEFSKWILEALAWWKLYK